MLAIVTAPDELYRGKFRGTYYLIPETVDEVKKHTEFNLMIAEAEAAVKTDKYGGSLRIQAALKFLVGMLTQADFITVDQVLKPEFNTSRHYALGMLGKLLRGALKARQLRQFNNYEYQRIQKARFNLKELVDKGLGKRWVADVAAGKVG